MPETAARRFAAALKKTGIPYLFGVPSGSMIDYIEAVRCLEGIDFILTTHEANAAFMAGVCGRLTGNPGACFATFGPGATNLSTGVGAAFLDRAPLIAFTDEMPEHLLKRRVQMNIDHQALFKPITKKTLRTSGQNIGGTLFNAAELALSGVPGPVHIGIPSDISQTRKNETQRHPARPGPVPVAEPDSFNQAAALLMKSEKPLMAIGLSAAKPGLSPLILSLLERLNIPVVLTPMAKGVLTQDHPLYAGVLAHALSDRVIQTCKQADLVLGVGYDPVEILYEDWAPGVPLIHIDSVPAEPETTSKPIVNLTGDLSGNIQALLDLKSIPFSWDLKRVQKTKNEMFKDLQPLSDIFGPRTVLKLLRDKLPVDAILTCDVGAHLHMAGQVWEPYHPQNWLITNGWSSMGFAIPAAIAAKLCCPDKQVACLTGDGGFLMSAGELATAVRLNLDIVFILLSDNDLSLIRIKQDKKKYPSNYGTHINDKGLFNSSTLLGVPVLGAGTPDEFASCLDKAFSTKGPVIIRADIDPKEYDTLILRS